MQDVWYLSLGKIYTFREGRAVYCPSEAVDKYRRNIMEIYKRREWKSSGAGAMFMNTQAPEMAVADINARVEALYLADDETLIYGASLEDSCGIYVKDPREPESPDRFIVRRTDMRLFHLDYEPTDKLLALSVSDGPTERHLALCESEQGDFRLITEGESLDIMPSFSRFDRQIIYFSSAGIFFDPRKRVFHSSAYALNRLDLRSGEIEEVAADAAYDYLRPREDAEQTLYCIRRPKTAKKGGAFSPLDIVLVPFRLIKALFAWLNFFSQRYTGESLTKRTSGVNPAREQQKTDEEIFIEGNLINATQALKQNTREGDKYPGVIPKTWELARRAADGDWEVVRRGVLDYTFDAAQNILYSNGKYIIRRTPDGAEEKICPAQMATSLCFAERVLSLEL